MKDPSAIAGTMHRADRYMLIEGLGRQQLGKQADTPPRVPLTDQEQMIERVVTRRKIESLPPARKTPEYDLGWPTVIAVALIFVYGLIYAAHDAAALFVQLTGRHL